VYEGRYSQPISFYDLKRPRGDNPGFIDRFLKYVLGRRYRGWTFYAHNGGRFDFLFLAEWLKFRGLKVRIIPRDSTIISVSAYPIKNQWHKVMFRDSYALMNHSLDKLTKDFDVEHKKLDFMPEEKDNRVKYKYLYEELFKKGDPLFFKYAYNDCLGLYEVLKDFYSTIEENHGLVGCTLASTALRSFRSDTMKHTLVSGSREMNDELREGYFGGRTEIFRMTVPEGKYFCFDVNSLYPFVMRDELFPCAPPFVNLFPKKDVYLENDGLTQAKVVCPDDLYLPVLPVRYEKKLYFPRGKFEGLWDNVLLRKAREVGYEIEPLKSYDFEETVPLFKDHIDKWYEIKRRAKKGTSQFLISKIFMNSLYGKFAQRQDVESVQFIHNPEDVPWDKVKDWIDPDYDVFLIKDESKANHIVPQISIHVTALAQLELYKYMEKILEKDRLLIYCDTDSVFTDYKLPSGDKLGQMDLEYEFRDGIFLLPKTYFVHKVDKHGDTEDFSSSMDGFIELKKAKGFQKEFRDNFSEEGYLKGLTANFEDFQIRTELQINPFRSSLKRHHTFLSMDRRLKSIQNYYDKRRVLPDFDTEPFSFVEICQTDEKPICENIPIVKLAP